MVVSQLKMETINEKLTIQALKEHDKVHPKLKAASKDPETTTSSNKEPKEEEKTRRVSTDRRVRLTSQSDSVSVKSVGVPKSDGRPSGMSFFRIVAATRAWQRLAKKSKAISQAQPQQPVIKLENTYRLDPVAGTEFSPVKVENVIRDVLDSRLSDVKYNPARSKTLATDLSTVIKGRVKMFDFKRYKIVCNVIVMENRDQGVHIASRCIWNSSTDNFATYTYKNGSIIAIAYVHGVYFE